MGEKKSVKRSLPEPVEYNGLGTGEKNILFVRLWRLWPRKGLCHLDRHLLLGFRSTQWPITRLAKFAFSRNFLLLDEASDSEDFDPVCSFHVVAHVHFVKLEGDVELGETRWKMRSADQSYNKLGTKLEKHC
jgi:hypothetical protein